MRRKHPWSLKCRVGTLNLASIAMADPGSKYVYSPSYKGRLERKSHLKCASVAAVRAEPGDVYFQVRWRGRRREGLAGLGV